ncbi:MAG: nucleotidyl transferase AbiEii/AbiGii toxin family protein [Bacteroidota bacterium]
MNFLKIDIEKLNDKALREVIILLEKAFNRFGVNFYLIGARARDFWFAAYNLSPKRGTRDIDFAVLVSDIKEFDELIDYLISNNDFKPIEKTPHRLICVKNDYFLDLLPFGGVAKAGYVNFNDRFDTTISVLGFSEVYAETINVDITDTDTIKMATLPGLCILKLVSWNDRPEERSKDIEDFVNIIEHYFDIESEKIYTDHLDLFDREDFDMQLVAARVLGRNMQRILNRSDNLKQRITDIIKKNIDDPEKSKIGALMIRGTDKYVTDAVNLLKEILTGITESELV